MRADLIEQSLRGLFKNIKDIAYSKMGEERVASIEFKDIEDLKVCTKWLKKFQSEYQREKNTILIDQDVLEDLLFVNMSMYTFKTLSDRMNGN